MRNGKRQAVIVITGASAAVGRIGLFSRGRAGPEGAKRDVEQLGGEALVLPTDMADAKAIERAAAEVEATFGPIDGWVNNAMCWVFRQ